ncbi:MAG: hypothetical protein E7620_00135 [Ruminococcaceae bacterium]|nr:hypothetical protein [Oscillospiraceae bacterium]
MIWRRLKKSTPEQDRELDRRMNEVKLSPKDVIALMASAFVMIVLPCLAVLLGLALVAMLLFGLL